MKNRFLGLIFVLFATCAVATENEQTQSKTHEEMESSEQDQLPSRKALEAFTSTIWYQFAYKELAKCNRQVQELRYSDPSNASDFENQCKKEYKRRMEFCS